MLSIYYLLICILVGYILTNAILKKRILIIQKQIEKTTKQSFPMFIFRLASAFIIGMLVVTWSVYLVSYAFKTQAQPLKMGNLICLSAYTLFVVRYLIKKQLFARYLKKLQSGQYCKTYRLETWFIASCTAFWGFFMYQSIYMNDNIIRVGHSVFSDFGPHLAVIRSFSYGNNFPTQYPHFADGTIRYHFMFQFLAGNLEYLGLNIADAFNVPSIISIVTAMFFLYTLAIILSGDKWVGILTNVLFVFRSSFSFFVFAKPFKSVWALIHAVVHSEDATEVFRTYIGNTPNENWGLWTQNVYVNQRHLSFGMAVLLFVIIMLLPGMVNGLEQVRKQRNISGVCKEIFLQKDSWIVDDAGAIILCGCILGLSSFWNGAMAIATLSVLFVLAFIAKNKLNYLIVAVLTVVLTLLQSGFFVASGASVVKPEFYFGFIFGNEPAKVLKTIIELLGVMPLLLICANIPTFDNKHTMGIKIVVSALCVLVLKQCMPEINNYVAILIYVVIVAFIILYNPKVRNIAVAPIVIIAFLMPFIVAFTLKLTPDVTVNHKYIVVSVMLLNIVVATILVSFYRNIKTTRAGGIKKIIFMILIFLLTITGVTDAFTLYNLDNNMLQYDNEDSMLLWIRENTSPQEIFLTSWAVTNPVLLAGRKIYYGWPYFSMSAGYDLAPREEAIRNIYGGSNAQHILETAKDNNICYVVIEEENRYCDQYVLNEALFDQSFETVYQDANGLRKIYSMTNKE